MATKIIRAKGGTAERLEDINSLDIPDVWHVAMRVAEAGDKRGSEMILECWYLAHDMRRALQQGDNLV